MSRDTGIQMSSKKDRERRYQAIRLYESGLISFNELKAQFRILATVANRKFTSQQDQIEVLKTKERLERLEKMTMTRDQAKLQYLMKLNKKPAITKTRDEAIAKFVSDYKTPIPADFSRYGILEAKTKRKNPPRPGTSRKKISNPRYIGFKQFNKDFDRLMKALVRLTRERGSKGARSEVSKASQKAKQSITVGARPGKY